MLANCFPVVCICMFSFMARGYRHTLLGEMLNGAVKNLGVFFNLFGFDSCYVQEGNVMDLCHVSEVRPGGVPKVGKFLVLVPS